MHLNNLLCTATLLLVCTLPALAQDKGYWVPNSSSAKNITGEIAIADARLTMDYFNFPIGQIRVLQAAEAAALFDADVNAPGGGSLYRLAVAADRRFLHKNTLCGTDQVQWMVTWVEGRTLSVAFFSGPNPPVLTMEALANTTDRCGTFLYSR
jgi:hypothetical protein